MAFYSLNQVNAQLKQKSSKAQVSILLLVFALLLFFNWKVNTTQAIICTTTELGCDNTNACVPAPGAGGWNNAGPNILSVDCNTVCNVGDTQSCGVFNSLSCSPGIECYSEARCVCTPPAVVNGACASPPSGNNYYLGGFPGAACLQGTVANQSGTGPWSWNCNGSGGGSTASCSSGVKTDGACGASDGGNFYSAPVSGLCNTGSASVVSGSGPWNWSCSGTGGGNTDFCSANMSVNGACGTAERNYLFSESAYTGSLCAVGSASPASPAFPTPAIPGTWTCLGVNGGTTDACTATRSAAVPPTISLTPDPINFSATYGGATPGGQVLTAQNTGAAGSQLNWTVATNQGWCHANPPAGGPVASFGNAAITITVNSPASVGAGSHTCTVTVSDPLATITSRSITVNYTIIPGNPSNPSLVLGNGSGCSNDTIRLSWIAGAGATSYNIYRDYYPPSTNALFYLSPLTGTPQFLINVASSPYIDTGLTTNGTYFYWVESVGGGLPGSTRVPILGRTVLQCAPFCDGGLVPFGVWKDCGGTLQCPLRQICMAIGSYGSCTGAGVSDGNVCTGGTCASGVCVSSVNGACQSPPNSSNYASGTFPGAACSAGTASAVSGSGPWSWNCNGSGGGSNASCSSGLAVNGACQSPPSGSNYASGTFPGAACSAGTTSSVSGTGPWTWNCNGSNGGSNAACSSGLAVNGACGTNAGNYTAAQTGYTGSFCSAGTASPASPAFPNPPGGPAVNWTCLGTNGGTNASCQATRSSAACSAGSVNLSAASILVGATSNVTTPGFTGCTISSSNSAIASTAGTVATGVAAGATNINATNCTDSVTLATGCSLTPAGINVRDFTVASSPGSNSITQGSPSSYTITVTSLNNFSGTVNLSLTGCPGGGTVCAYVSSALAVPAGGSANTVLNITNTGASTPGTHTLTTTGTSGTRSRNSASSLIISAGSAPTVDLQINGSGGPVNIARGATGSITWTSANATSCTASNARSDGAWTGAKPLSGGPTTSAVFSTNVSSPFRYTLACDNGVSFPTDFVDVSIPFCNVQNFVGGSVSPPSVTVGGAYSVFCDYGIAGIDDIAEPTTGSGTCSASGGPGLGYKGFVGTAAQFDCRAGNTPGNNFAVQCQLVFDNGAGAPHYFCPLTNPVVGGITVTALACPAGSVTLTPSSISTGNTSTASAPAGWSGGTYISSNSGVATVSGSTVTGVSVGSSNISGTGWTAPNGAVNCALSSAALTVTVAPPPPPPPPTGDNTSTNAAVACATVLITWTDVAGETEYHVYRDNDANPNSGATLIYNSSAPNILTYTYTTPDTNPYYYFVASANSGGESTRVPASSNPVASVSCGANLTGSDKDIITFSGVSFTPTACNGSYEATPSTVKFFENGTVSFRINICNTTGLATSTSVIVTDYLTNLIVPTGGWVAKLDGVNMLPDADDATVSCPAPLVVNHYKYCSTDKTVVFNVGSVGIGLSRYITFDAQISTALGPTSRFNNRAEISFVAVPSGPTQNRRASIPWLPYYTTKGTPGKIEISPQ